jgi:serine acetyltransferase
MAHHSPEALVRHGITLPAPAAVWVEDDVDIERIARRGVTLHPMTRIAGAQTTIGEGSEIGAQGPVVLRDCALGRRVRIASGTVESATLLDGASLGPNAHVRAGTLLEEEASTAHAVGLKQTIILAFGTLGSQINFCDCLLAGGRSRKDHSEVGSGFIHFNFTPFGAQGDKATASLFGGVPRSVLLRENRIFLGGAGGVVGPIEIGFGCVLAAGSVYRRDYADGLLVYGEPKEARAIPFDPYVVRRVEQKMKRSLRYIGHLRALAAWYRRVRLAPAREALARYVLESALVRLAEGERERVEQVDRLFENRRLSGGAASGGAEADFERWQSAKTALATGALPEAEGARVLVTGTLEPGRDHFEWVRSLSDVAAHAAVHWLGGIVASVEALADA